MPPRPKSDIARRTLSSLRACSPNDKGLLVGDINSFDVSIGPASIARVVALIDKLAEFLATGATPPAFESGGRRMTIVKVDGEGIQLRIVEEVDRTKHNPTPEERGRLKERFVYPRVPDWDYSPAGRLRLEVAETLYGGKEAWSDRPDQTLEVVLPLIVRAIRETAARQRASRAKIDEQARLSAARERERWDAEERKRKQDERHRALVAEAKRWEEAALLREYAGELQRAAAMSSLAGDYDALGALIEELHDASDHMDPIPDRLSSLLSSAVRAEKATDVTASETKRHWTTPKFEAFGEDAGEDHPAEGWRFTGRT